MNRKFIYANSILWASAVIAAALLHAPVFFTLILLPSLATTSLLLALPAAPRRCCGAS
jgi:hypothetical protein